MAHFWRWHTSQILRRAGVLLSVALLGLPAAALQMHPKEGQAATAARTPDAAKAERVFAALLDEASKAGFVKVIVRLDVPFSLDSDLPTQKAKVDQQASIAASQAAIFAKIPSLEPTSERVTSYEFIPHLALTVSASELLALRSLAEVRSIKPDKPHRPHLAQSVPLVGGSAAWAQGFTGDGQYVAILDSGVDKNSSFLSGKVAEEACYSIGFFQLGLQSLCPGFLGRSTAPGSALPYPSGGTCTPPLCDHGTHVAGIVAGGSPSWSGLAKGAKLIAIQVFHRKNFFCGNYDPPCISADDSNILSGLQRVYQLRNTYPIAAINMSLGGERGYEDQQSCDDDYEEMKLAIDQLKSSGIATVISSGNDGYRNALSGPACISSAISVGSTWDETSPSPAANNNNCFGNDLGTPDANEVACYSNTAPFLKLLAPGSYIRSSVPVSEFHPSGEDIKHGTSMAAPHVAAAWALLKQKQSTLSVDEAYRALCRTGLPVTDPRSGVTKTRISVDAALASVGSTPHLSFSGMAVDRKSDPVPDARIYFTVNGRTYSTFSNAAGKFTLSFEAAGVPETIAFWVTKQGFFPYAAFVSTTGCASDVGTLVMEPSNASTVILEVEPDVHHLGDSSYDGTINSGFQKPNAEGTSWQKSFQLTVAQAAASEALLTFIAKGVQRADRVLINAQVIGTLASSPDDGSYAPQRIPVPVSILRSGSNSLAIESVLSADYDDFEFTNVALVLSNVAVQGVPSAPVIGAVVPGNSRAIVSFTPGAMGSGTLLDYTAECGSSIARRSSSPITVEGLSNGVSYRCRVRATSTVGDSPWSQLSAAVVPSRPDDGFGGAMPAGWSQPTTSQATWLATADSAYGGTQSLRSGLIGNGQKSEVGFSSTQGDGRISFALRVSSEQGYDFLEFWVDGTRLARWSGEVPWTVVSFNMPAGTHSFVWRYVKDGSSVAGADAAWIDSVTFTLLQNFSISISKTGNGAGTVTGTGGISCGAVCSASLLEGTTVTLSPGAAQGSIFLGWSGACSGSGTCTVQMDASKAATAHFYLIPDNGFPAGGGLPPGWASGAGSAAPWRADTGTAFGGTHSLRSGAISDAQRSDLVYTASFPEGIITFAYKVSSESGYDFLEFLVDGVVRGRWSGLLDWNIFSLELQAGTHTFTWRYSKDGNTVAGEDAAWIDSVVLPGTPSYRLTVARAGLGTGTVTGTLAGISCGAFCAGNVLAGSQVVLTASPATGSSFGGWQGACGGFGNCTISMDAAKTVTALFNTGSTGLMQVSAVQLDFGGQSMNTFSPPQTVTVTNAGGAPLSVLSVSASSQFRATHNCVSEVTPGATCQVLVTFAPSTAAQVSGTVSIQSSVGGASISVVGIGERSLVSHYYRSILRRAPDAGGKAFWESEATRVANLGVNVNEAWFAMAMSFFSSAEYQAFNRSSIEYIRDLYTTFFNREADTAGLTFWLSELSAGLPREVAVISFMFSAEFTSFAQAIFGNTTARAEVDTVIDFYRGLLSRLPDSMGFNYWLGVFRTAQCSGESAIASEVEAISSAYANSSEYAARNRTNAQYVGDLYNAFLRRGGDVAGVRFWIGQIDTGARTRSKVRQDFIASPEFSARVSRIMAQGCLR